MNDLTWMFPEGGKLIAAGCVAGVPSSATSGAVDHVIAFARDISRDIHASRNRGAYRGTWDKVA